MKQALTFGVLIALALGTGCATSGYRKAEVTSLRMADTANRIAVGKNHVNEAMRQLNAMVSQPQADLRPLFNDFQEQIKTIDRQASSVRTATDGFIKRRDAYVEAWTDEIMATTNVDIRNASLKRRNETIIEFKKIEAAMNAAGQAYRPLLKDLKDISSTLGFDLTAQGIRSIAPIVARAKTDAADLAKKIDHAMGDESIRTSTRKWQELNASDPGVEGAVSFVEAHAETERRRITC